MTTPPTSSRRLPPTSGGASDSGGDATAAPVIDQQDLPEDSRGLRAPKQSDFPGIDQQTEEGAYAAAAYYWTAHYYALATDDTAPLRQVLDLEACEACNKVVDSIESNARQARVTPLPTIMNEQFALAKEGSTWIVRYEFRRSVTTTYVKGAPIVQREEADVEAYVALEWQNGQWRVGNEAVEYHEPK